MVSTTSLSLLQRLQHAKPAASDWQRLDDIYRPYIRAWVLRFGIDEAEADDLTQEVFVVLSKDLPSFEPLRNGSFRAWLRQIVLNQVRNFRKARKKRPQAGRDGVEQLLSQLENPNSDLSRQWDRDHDQHVIQKLMAIVKPDFETKTWEAFVRSFLHGQPAKQVAQELEISEGAVAQAKYRILKRLRAEGDGLMDS
jgi:RNA polymerase sigma-70 factor (ECF subfamily)